MSILTLRPAFATSRPFRSAVEAEPSAFARQVDVLRSLSEIESIADDWRALETRTPEATGFQSYDWCRAWMRACGGADRDRWRIVVVRDGDRVVSLWPLERERILGARVLQWLGGPWTQYGDALVIDGPQRIAHLAAGWREIAAWNDVDLIKLSRVRDEAALADLPGFRGRTVIHIEHAPFLDLSQAPPRPDKRLRSRRRKLEEHGTVAFDVVADPVERQAYARQAIAWKRDWLRMRGRASAGLFHESLDALMAGLAESEALVIGRLRVGDHAAAIEIGIQANGAFRSLLGAHDARFSMGSPGHLLIAEMIAWCGTAGIRFYDLMVPADEYKRRWSNAEALVRDHLVVTRLRGRLAAAWFRARPAAKRIYARAPRSLRRMAAPARPG